MQNESATEKSVAICRLSKNKFFDSLAEGKGAVKTSKPDSSAYRWYGRVRFVR